MKKKILSLFLVIVLLLGCMPLSASAQSTAAQIEARLKEISVTSYPPGRNGLGNGGCHEFARRISNLLFGTGIPQAPNYSYKLTNLGNWELIGSAHGTDNVRTLMKKARAGDLYRAVSSTTSMHTGIVYSADSGGFRSYHSIGGGVGGKTVIGDYVTWNKLSTSAGLGTFDKDNQGLSLYRCKLNVVGDAVTTGAAESITETSALLRGTVTGSIKPSEVGMYLGTSTSNMTKLGSEGASGSSPWKYYYKTQGRRTLTRSTTYFYQAYAVVSGKTVWGEVKSFHTPPAVTFVEPTLDLSTYNISMYNGQTAALTATVTPGYTIEWSNSDPSVATYSNGKVTAKAPGTTTISAAISYTNASGYGNAVFCTCSVTVKPYASIPGKPTVAVNGNTVTVSWSSAKNATGYEVYLLTQPWGWNAVKYSKKNIAANVTSCTFTNVADTDDYAAFVLATPYKSAQDQTPWTHFTVHTQHIWEKDYTVDKPATATEDGEKSIHCTKCDERKDITAIPANTDGDVPFDPTPENDFVDVPNGAYFAKAVNWAVDNGVTEGTSRTTFSPNRVCTRAQAVTFLWRSAGSPKPSLNSTKFTDVPAGEYYTDAVLWAVENGITGGVSETSFAPNSKCTRAQIVSFMYRMKGAPAVGGVSPFLDVPPSLYYAGAVAWAVENGITEGTSANYFSPHNDCSRGQIVTFLYRGK